jgi:NADH-quinone oxidoreductase subunit N
MLSVAAVAAPLNLGADLLALSPVLVLFAGAMIVLLVEAIQSPQDKRIHLVITMGSIAAALALTVLVQADGPKSGFAGMVAYDQYGVFFNVVVLLASLLAVVVSPDYLARIGVAIGEYYALSLFAAMGMVLMNMASNLIMLFIALEIMSISFYILCGMKRSDPKSVESGFKYFILGAFSSAILLYGIAFVYGATGTVNLAGIREGIANGADPSLLFAGLGLLIVGFGFKVGAVPFHMWTPDVYQGAPTSVTGMMATGVKAASFAAFGRVLVVGFMDVKDEWVGVLWVLAAATIMVGNVAALVQDDLKRMLAYSAVGHAGFLLMALVGIGDSAQASGLLFYLLAYVFMSMGAFAVLTLFSFEGQDLTDIKGLTGLASEHPWIAAGLSVCLLSLAGIPPTMGFVAKFYVFSAAISAGYVGLAVVGAIGGAIGVFYYLRPIVTMYMKSDVQPVPIEPTPTVNGVLGLAVAAVLVFGLLPNLIVPLAKAGLASLGG